jgi:cytoskeletal protein RodZ
VQEEEEVVEEAPVRERARRLRIHLGERATGVVLIAAAFILAGAFIFFDLQMAQSQNRPSAPKETGSVAQSPSSAITVPDMQSAPLIAPSPAIESQPSVETVASEALITPQPTWSNAGMPTGVQAQVAIDVPLRLRAGPSIDAPQMQNPDSLMPTVIVDVIGQNADGTWFKVNVQLSDDQLRSAWVSAEFVTLSGSGVIPVVP